MAGAVGELDERNAIGSALVVPGFVGLPIGCGDFFRKDGEAAFGVEYALVQFVGDVALGVGRDGVDGLGKLGAPTIGKLYFDAAGFGAWNPQLDGSDGRIFFVDSRRRNYLEGGGDAVFAPIGFLHAMVVERDDERLRRIVDVIDLC